MADDMADDLADDQRGFAPNHPIPVAALTSDWFGPGTGPIPMR